VAKGAYCTHLQDLNQLVASQRVVQIAMPWGTGVRTAPRLLAVPRSFLAEPSATRPVEYLKLNKSHERQVTCLLTGHHVTLCTVNIWQWFLHHSTHFGIWNHNKMNWQCYWPLFIWQYCLKTDKEEATRNRWNGHCPRMFPSAAQGKP
jgi:hypothetical protein